MMNKLLRMFVKVWLGLVAALTLMSFAGQILTAPSVLEGILKIITSMDPFSLPNLWTTLFVLSAPAFAVHMWIERRSNAPSQASRTS